MKNNTLYFLLVITVAISCKKSGVNNDQNSLPSTTIEVLETSTNKPIEGATVYLLKCAGSGLSCMGYSTYSKIQTNSSGIVTYTWQPGIIGVEIVHKDYWIIQPGSILPTYYLTPKCTIKTTIKKVKMHSPTDVLNIIIYDPKCQGCWTQQKAVGLPADTTIYFQAQGYNDNQVSWYMNSSAADTLHLPPVYINRFDTANVTIEY